MLPDPDESKPMAQGFLLSECMRCSYSLIHEIPEIKNTQQNGRGATERKVLLCAMPFFLLWNCLDVISIEAKFGSNNTKGKSTWLDLDAAFSL